MQSRRQQILEILKDRGGCTVAELAAALDITSVTVRHHLDVLRTSGLVAEPEIRHRSSVGRPEYVFRLTDEAGSHFPKNYAGLAGDLLTTLKDRVPSSEFAALFAQLGERMASEAGEIDEAQALPRRLDRLVGYLDDKGYMARWEKSAQGYVVHTRNCPYEALAQSHDEVCVADRTMIATMLHLPVKQVCHLQSGDDTCSYLVGELISADLPLTGEPAEVD